MRRRHTVRVVRRARARGGAPPPARRAPSLETSLEEADSSADGDHLPRDVVREISAEELPPPARSPPAPPNRCSAISPANRSRISGDPRPLAMAREERIQPGAMAFTVTLYGPSSDASLRV